MRTVRWVALLLVCWCLSAGSGLWAAEDARTLYDRYLAAYKNYQEAVARHAPEGEVKALAAAFNQARAAYEGAVAMGESAPAVVDDWATSDEVALPTPNGTGAAESAPVPEAAPSTPDKMPPALSSTLKDLWSDKGPKIADKAIKTLERFAAAHATTVYGAQARYEIAKAHEYLRGDTAAAIKVLTEIAADPNAGKYARLAQDRLRYLEATRQYVQWKATLDHRRDAMEAAYASYRKTSWLAIPVKVFRWTGYVGKLLSFQRALNDFEAFELKYESIAAPYVPPVDVVFNLFPGTRGARDDHAVVRLIYDNNQAWYARWKILSEAKTSIDLQYFIVENDIFGMALCGLLLRKAKAGLKIRFMMDARGTKGFTRKLMGQDFIQELVTYPNVEVKTFNPIHQDLGTALFDLRLIMASNHDKIIVVDGEYSIIGGRNVSSHYYVNPEDMPDCYRDCDVLIRSQAVAQQLAAAFEEEFAPLKQYSITKDLWGNIDIMSRELEAAATTMDQYIRGRGVYRPAKADRRTSKALEEFNAELKQYKSMTGYEQAELLGGAHTAPVKIIDKHSLYGPRNDIADQLIRFIDGSRREIVIQNPYVVLTERAEAALKRAARRGVRILIHTNSPASTDSLPTQAMFYADWKRILKEIPTCRIFTYYGKRKLHAKNFVFDGKIGIVGTYNMDYLSQDVNSEVVAAIKSTAFARELRNEILGDIARSKEYKIAVDADGQVTAVFGPDDLPGKRMWLMKALSKLTFLKKII